MLAVDDNTFPARGGITCDDSITGDAAFVRCDEYPRNTCDCQLWRGTCRAVNLTRQKSGMLGAL